MKTIRTLVVLGFASVLIIGAGCDSEGDSGGTDVAAPADTGDQPGADIVTPGEDIVMPGEDVQEPGEDVPVTPAGACLGAGDMAIIGDETKDISTTSKDCAFAIGFSAEALPGIVDCIVNGLPTAATPIVGLGLSEGCATCYGQSTLCGAGLCFTQCAANPNSADCRTCLCANCLSEFYPCTGLENTCPAE